MLNIIYKTFPYGNSESFVDYEIPFFYEITQKTYRIFSFYKGEKKEHKRKDDLLGDVFIVKISPIDYVKSAVSILLPKVRKEFSFMKNRVCRDSFMKCLWRMLYYRAYGYAFLNVVRHIGVSDGDVFVSYWFNECAYAIVMLKEWYKNIKIVSRIHGFDVFEDRCYLPFRNEMYKKIDCVYPVNAIEKKYILERYSSSISDDRIRVSHLGINLPDNWYRTNNRSQFTVVSCSSIIPLKRLDMIIDALSEITEFSYKWIHIGGGPLEDQMKKRAAMKLVASNQEYVFLGQLSLTEVHRFYRESEATLFVNCSDTEGVPVSIMEAMSYGIPVIARDVGGNSEIVDNRNGILLHGDCTVHDLSEGIKSVFFKNSFDYLTMRRAAREKVEREFNADVQYRAFIKEVMKPITANL